MKQFKKFKNMQGYRIAYNISTDLNRNRQLSDIHSYMALAELLGLVDRDTAKCIIELGTEFGMNSIQSQEHKEFLRRERNESLFCNEECDRDENQDWSDVM